VTIHAIRPHDRRATLAGLTGLLGAALLPSRARAADAELQVLHWWTSAGERAAVEVLVARLAEQGLRWRDAAIPGGAGTGAGKVLRSRVLAGDAPDASQLVGATIAEWAELGVLLELDDAARDGQWEGALFPAVWRRVTHRGHVVAAPLGLHRINLLLVHRPSFARLGLAVPADWAGWEAAAAALQRAGLTPLALSREPWQVATLFESLVLASGGAGLHRDLFVRLDERAASDPRLATALQRLRMLRGWAGGDLTEAPWTATLARLQRGEAAMMVMGDWAKAELQAAGWALGEQFDCVPVPGTARWHLYSIDSLAMFAKDYAMAPAQERLAAALLAPALQAAYSRAKGSAPVRRDADPAAMDAAARASWQLFARGAEVQAPSLVHRMATGESRRDALIAEVQRFFLNDSITVADAQRRLAAVLRILAAGTEAPGR
jgi:glucose/mannose transport system substrate-binding protein